MSSTTNKVMTIQQAFGSAKEALYQSDTMVGIEFETDIGKVYFWRDLSKPFSVNAIESSKAKRNEFGDFLPL